MRDWSSTMAIWRRPCSIFSTSEGSREDQVASNDQEEYEARLRWRLEILKSRFEDGTIKIAEHLVGDIQRSLSAVRYDEVGKVDLDTVDGRIRSMALAVSAIDEREKAKKSVSLNDISHTYFQYIDKNLGFLHKIANEKKVNAHEFARAVSKSNISRAEIVRAIPEFMETLEGFWGEVSDISHYHIQDIAGSKAVFGGDLFPSYAKNIASSVGLYTDNIVLSDPFLQSKQILEKLDDESKAYYIVKHAINVLGYKNLALADLDVPIVSITPFRSSVSESERKMLLEVTGVDALKRAEALFGRNFSSPQELWTFGLSLKEPEEVFSELKNPDLLIFDTEWKGSKIEQIKRALSSKWSKFDGPPNAGSVVVGQCFGRMGQATDLIFKSRYLGGVPLIDAETSWRHFNFKLQYNSAMRADGDEALHVVRALQGLSETDAEWLGNIPPESLIEIRKAGAFADIRTMLSEGIGDLSTLSPENYYRTKDKVFDNIEVAFERHKKEIKSLNEKKVKFAGFDVGSWLVAGSIEIGAAVTGSPLFGVAAYMAGQVFDAPTLRKIPARFRELKDAHIELKKSPMGMFFKHKPKSWRD